MLEGIEFPDPKFGGVVVNLLFVKWDRVRV
jgi:hypothetical protein